MQYRTELNISELFPKINPREKITLLGSCFSDNIGKKLIRSKFSAAANPLGTIFNPVSIAKIISKYLVNENDIDSQNLWIENEIVSHPDFHSIHNTLNVETFITKLNDNIRVTSNHFKDSNFLILTLGTAHVYLDISRNVIVSNCHKRPANNFRKHLLSIDEIVMNLFECIDHSKKHTILTVSPVRHIKDGIIENTRSKARLIESCHLLEESIENCHYFPAYEIMMDDLRDYRYYKRDLIHPDDVAIDYIWDQFTQFAMNEEAKDFINKNENLAAAINHLPKLPESKEFQKFCTIQLKKIEDLQIEYPFVNYDLERNHFKQYLR